MNTFNKKTTSLSKLIKGDTPVLVDFFTDWCGPCKVQSNILEDLKREVDHDIHIIKIDAEKNADITIRYNVRGVPTLILFHQGHILWKKVGVVRLTQLKEILNQKMGWNSV